MKLLKKRKNNKGFSMLELLIAVAILSVVAVTVGLAMTSSSQTYRAVSTESQMQSEAQVVANSISNYVIDANAAESPAGISVTEPDSLTIDDASNNFLLITKNEASGSKSQICIFRDTTNDKLYYYTRAYDDATGTFGSALLNKSLLADNVTGFTVDTSRMDNENILCYTLTYSKNGRDYTGNYQVFLRNRKYAEVALPSGVSSNTTPKLLSLSIEPRLVYIDTHAGRATGYSVMNGANLEAKTLMAGAAMIPFTATLTYSGTVADDLKTADWTLLGADENLFNIADGKSTTKNLEFPKSSSYGFADANKYSFYVMASRGSKSSKADVHIKIVKDLKVRAVAGISTWKNAYFSSPYNATKAAQVPDTNYGAAGKTVTLSASLEQYNVTDGIDWRLYYCASDKTSDKDWKPCTDAKYASLLYPSYSSGTTNTLSLGSDATGFQFKIEAISRYDDTYKDTVYIGVVPDGKSDNGGLFSRGYYMNIQDFFTSGNGGKAIALQGGGSDRQYLVKKITNIKFEPGVNMDNMKDLEKAFKYDPVKNTLMVDYTIFQYSKQQSATAYSQGFEINMTITYEDVDGVSRTFGIYKFPILPTDVVAIGSSTICVAKGSTDEIPVQFTYTNLINKNLIGIYTKQYGDTDFSENINKTGYESNDKYLTIKLREGELGDVYHYVDTAKFDISGKTNLKTYPINYVTVRVTMDDYYQLKDQQPSKGSGSKTLDGGNNIVKNYTQGTCTDYTIYVANVEGSDVYFAGPDAVKCTNEGGNNQSIGWLNSVTTAKKNIVGIRTNGSKVTGKVYKSGSSYKLEYGGTTYTFNRTYNYWK